jgi:hypothetical protein
MSARATLACAYAVAEDASAISAAPDRVNRVFESCMAQLSFCFGDSVLNASPAV